MSEQCGMHLLLSQYYTQAGMELALETDELSQMFSTDFGVLCLLLSNLLT